MQPRRATLHGACVVSKEQSAFTVCLVPCTLYISLVPCTLNLYLAICTSTLYLASRIYILHAVLVPFAFTSYLVRRTFILYLSLSCLHLVPCRLYPVPFRSRRKVRGLTAQGISDRYKS